MFLEDYVMKHVDQDRLERWLIRKTRKLKIKAGKKPSSSLDHENNKQSGKRPVLILGQCQLYRHLKQRAVKVFFGVLPVYK